MKGEHITRSTSQGQVGNIMHGGSKDGGRVRCTLPYPVPHHVATGPRSPLGRREGVEGSRIISQLTELKSRVM